MKILQPQIVGGRFFLRVRDYLPFLPWVYVFSATSRAIPITEPIFWWWILADSIAIVAMAVWFLVGTRLLFPQRAQRPVALWAVMAFGALLGGLKGVVTGAVGVALGIESDLLPAILDRMIQTMLVGAWVVPATSIFAATLHQLSAERETVLRARVSKQLQRPWELAPLLSKRTAPLVNTLVTAQATHPEGLTPEAVRRLVDEHIRPLSSALWTRVGKDIPPYRLRQLYALYFSGPLGVPWVALALWSATTWPAIVWSHGVTGANTAVFALTLSVVPLFSLTRFVSDQGALWGAIALLIATTASGAGAVGLSFLIDGRAAFFLDPVALVGSMTWFALLTINAGAVVILRRSMRHIRAELESLEGGPFAPDAAEAETVLIDQKLARMLHNDVQNRLLALADQAQSRDERLHATDIVTILDAVGRGVASTERPRGLAGTLSDVAARWAGVMDVRIDALPQVSVFDEAGVHEVVKDIVTEAITNAARHGLATAVEVRVDAQLGETGVPELFITVRDDGVGPRNGSPGLGSELLTTVSGGRWSLEQHEDGGSVLRVALAPAGVS